MSTPSPYFAPTYTRLLYRFVQLQPQEHAAFFAGVPAGEAEVLSADFPLTFEHQMKLVRNALAIRPAGLGLRIGRQLHLASHGVLGTAMQHAESLSHALTLFSFYSGTRASFFGLQQEDAGDDCRITLSVVGLDDELHAFFTESILTTLLHCIAFFAGNERVLKALTLSYPTPSHGRDYTVAFHTHPTFGQDRSQIIVSRATMAQTHPDRDPTVFENAIRLCDLELQKTRDSGLRQQAEEFLRRNPGKLWTADEVARAISTSRRTLLRRLADEGLRYQSMRDDILKAQAVSYLETETVATTAAALGFADESSFRRSYRRWFGVPPSRHHR